MPKLLVAGVGNVLLGDDAFGVEVVQQLARRPQPEGVCVTDFGTRSYDLAYALLDNWDMVILVDAVPRGEQPGTVSVIEPELPADGATPSIDAHSMNPAGVLRLVAALASQIGNLDIDAAARNGAEERSGRKGGPRKLLLVGCEPLTVEAAAGVNVGLSEPVRAAVPEAIRVIEEIISARSSNATAA